MSQIAYDVAYERMGELATAMAEARDRNEAATRLQLIDRLLFDCLGWRREDADPEDHENGQYADYVLPHHNRRLVVEAKREGTSFDLPDGLERISNLEALLGLGGDVADALKQAQDYAYHRGVPYAAICNGHQLVAFIATRQDGVGPHEGKALVFASPEEMVEDFAKLWALNPTACASMHLSRLLGGKSQARPPKLSDTIENYPGTAKTSSRLHTIATLHGLFLPDYVRDDEEEDKFLLECYCPPGAFSSLAMLNKSVLRTRYSMALGEELKVGLEEAITKDGLNPLLREEVAVSSAGREPMVLLGDIGVGKTMFLRRLLRVDAKEIAADGILLYTDLGRDAVLSSDIKAYVSASFKEQLRERYDTEIDEADFLRGTYQAEVKRFAKSVHGELADTDQQEFRRREIDHLAGFIENTEEHLRRSLEHLVKLRHQQVIVVLDNIDQRLQPEQEQVFLIAASIAKTWPCTVFVTLRPETFNASRIDKTLSGYQPRAFTVQPPRVEKVIAKRLEFGAKFYREEGRLPEWMGWTTDSEDLPNYLDVLIKSFKRSEPLQRALVNLSGGNARRALELMQTFISSPHAEHERTLDRNSGSSDYLVPAHAFLGAVLLGDAEYYDPDKSRIPNLFDISTLDPREHFLLPCALGLLQRESSQHDAEGYVLAEETYRTFQDLGFTPSQIDFALSRAIAGALIEPLPPEAGLDEIQSVRLTTVGVYAYQALPADFQYHDAVVVDTPISDPAARENVRTVRAIKPRLERAEAFLAYLDDAWDAAGLEEASLFDWSRNLALVREEIQGIHQRLQ